MRWSDQVIISSVRWLRPAAASCSYFGLLIACVLANAATDAHVSGIRKLVRDQVTADGPGIAVLVMQNGAVVYKEGFGLADVKAGKPITAASLFDLASVSKHFTGIAILTLVEANKLKLDRAVADYLPDYHVPIKKRAVTIADLLHHVSGLADYTSDDWDGSDEDFAALTPTTHLEWLNGTKPHRAPGIKFVYNNSEYALLAAVIEKVSGMSYSKYVQQHLFKPAGMDHTFVLDGSAKPPSTTVKGYITGDDGGVKRSSLPTVITGDGNIYSSIDDLTHWLAALESDKVISPKLAALAYKNGRFDNGKPIKDADGNGYGFGWVVPSKGKRVWHTGSWYGTSSYIVRDLDTTTDVVVLSNDENADVAQLGDDILDLFTPE